MDLIWHIQIKIPPNLSLTTSTPRMPSFNWKHFFPEDHASHTVLSNCDLRDHKWGWSPHSLPLLPTLEWKCLLLWLLGLTAMPPSLFLIVIINRTLDYGPLLTTVFDIWLFFLPKPCWKSGHSTVCTDSLSNTLTTRFLDPLHPSDLHCHPIFRAHPLVYLNPCCALYSAFILTYFSHHTVIILIILFILKYDQVYSI